MVMAASGGLVSIHVLNRLSTFLELKSYHIGLLSCRTHFSTHGNRECPLKHRKAYKLGLKKLISNSRLKPITSLQRCLSSHSSSCCYNNPSCFKHTPNHLKEMKTISSPVYDQLSFIPSRSFHPYNTLFNSSSCKDTAPQDDPLDPFKLVESELANLSHDIREELDTNEPLLQTMSHYYFDGKGKTFRPLVALLMSKACNIHSCNNDSISWSQKIVAMVAEMIHTASLVHDDVIDASNTRRGQESLNKLHGQRQSILTGDYILAQASIALSRIGHARVICVLSTILDDLVSGEFMQLGSKEDENERFAHYLQKTYKKTASLIANTCKSVALLSDCSEDIVECAFQYGRNLGIAFQLVDDLLDFISSDMAMGKPTAADLKLGLATAPVLFAAQEHSDLHPLIMRRFSQPGDVEYTRQMVAKSNGVEQTRILAAQHSKEAIKNVEALSKSIPQKGLIQLAHILLERKK